MSSAADRGATKRDGAVHRLTGSRQVWPHSGTAVHDTPELPDLWQHEPWPVLRQQVAAAGLEVHATGSA